MRTRVAIIGAGPAGLTLAHLLYRVGIETVVLESHTRRHVETRIRAGILEHGTVETFRDLGLAGRLDHEGLEHRGVELRFDGGGHRIAFDQLVGRSIWVYGQQDVVKDLISARVESCQPLLFEAEAIGIDGLDSTYPSVRYRQNGAEQIVTCDFVAGCDGFHGVARQAMPLSALREYAHEYPFGWVGILAAVPPSTDELIYASHTRGFALHSLRSPELSRLYIQCEPNDTLEKWPDRRIWDELHTRLECPGWSLAEGPVLERGITLMRSYVAEPMQHGRLYLAGDAAHIVPPTGAKGLNLAVADVRVLARGLIEYYTTGDTGALDTYTETCLRRVWKVMHFSAWMTSMFHKFPGDLDGTQRRLQLAQLDYVTSSEAAAKALAEQYTGLP